MPILSYIEAIQLAMEEEMERDERVFILGEDVGNVVEFSELQMDYMRNLENRGS